MPSYKVCISEVWVQEWIVDADSQEEALDKAMNGDGEEGEYEYSHCLEDGHEVIEQAKEKIIRHRRKSELRFKKVSEDEYSVFDRARLIGRVGKGWFRNCGNGWSHNLKAYWGFRTRQEAAIDLLRLRRKQNA
jgi:hypothetical protein